MLLLLLLLVMVEHGRCRQQTLTAVLWVPFPAALLPALRADQHAAARAAGRAAVRATAGMQAWAEVAWECQGFPQ